LREVDRPDAGQVAQQPGAGVGGDPVGDEALYASDGSLQGAQLLDVRTGHRGECRGWQGQRSLRLSAEPG